MPTLSRTLIVFILCGFSFSGVAQQSAAPQLAPEAPAAPGADRRVVLDVVVTDKSGNPVSGLQQGDFTVLDSKQPQKILSFQAANSEAPEPPPQAILLIDAVNTSFQSVAYGRQQIEKYLQQGGELPIPVSLVVLTGDAATQLHPTQSRDGKALAAALDSSQSGLRTIRRSEGFYGAVERVQISLRTLQQYASYEAKQPGRKFLIWLSPGWPLLTGPGVELSGKDQKAVFEHVVELSTQLREARITLYSVDPLGTADAGTGRTFYYESYLKGVTSAKKVENANLALQVLAAQSGGRVLNASNDIAGAIANCVADAKAFYTLSIDSPRADNPDEYHSLQIKIAKPGLTARTRTGYYAQP